VAIRQGSDAAVQKPGCGIRQADVEETVHGARRDLPIADRVNTKCLRNQLAENWAIWHCCPTRAVLCFGRNVAHQFTPGVDQRIRRSELDAPGVGFAADPFSHSVHATRFQLWQGMLSSPGRVMAGCESERCNTELTNRWSKRPHSTDTLRPGNRAICLIPASMRIRRGLCALWIFSAGDGLAS